MSDITIRDQLAAIIRAPRGHTNEAGGLHAAIADAILAAGWRPPARVITDPDEAEELPDGTVILVAGETVAARISGVGGVLGRWWQVLDGDAIDTAEELMQLSDAESVTVLHVPTEESDR
ncbi:hypothetical protein [Nocardia cyriacigeorgica]|uniref:hypothetical protein n=1 Tax=Nocardia cyriacigeorgica TaxID=135487 RepID=UPI0024578963|nr:hypothetical protein [Nocardia cyriacigeorgica]